MHPSFTELISFDCSLGKHTSRSKNKRWLWHTSAFSGKNIYYRSDLLQQAETLVTVSPCEFPPRCSPRLLLRHPRVGEDPLSSCRGSPFLSPCHPGPSYLSSPLSFWSAAIESRGSPLIPRISHFLHLIFPRILYRLHTNNLLKRIWL